VARICRTGGVPADRLHVVHDGVDPRRTAGGDRRRGRRNLGIDDDRPLLLNVARLTDHKGHRYLLDALPAVLAKHPNACLALAGDGELRRDLQARAAQLGIPNRVRFLGYRHDVPDLLAACDLFVMPSHREGLGSSLIDVMLAGRPIVATTGGGIPELVGCGTSGESPVAYLVPPRDPASLSQAICRALAAPAELAEMTGRGLLRAQSHFTADCMVEATLNVYRDSLPGRTGRSSQQPGTSRAA
jgi:glycosyltransferase involved in cell wall biosynthesis